MSQIKLENLSSLVPTETVLPEPGRVRDWSDTAGSFGDHLRQIRTESEEATSGARGDSTSPDPSMTPPAGAAGQPAAEHEPDAPDRDGGPRDSAEVDSDSDVTGPDSLKEDSEEDQTGTDREETESEDGSASQTAEAGLQIGQEQKIDVDSEPDGAAAANPRKSPDEPLVQQLEGQIDQGGAKPSAAEAASAKQGVDSTARPRPEQVAAPNGLELLQALSGEGFAGLFGFVTTEGSDKMRQLAMDEGAKFLITKPFTAQSFQDALGATLG